MKQQKPGGFLAAESIGGHWRQSRAMTLDPPCSQSLYKMVMASNWVSGGAIRRRKARGGGRAFSKKGDTRD